MTSVHVPGEAADLAEALASGAEEIVLHGVVAGGLELDRPVTIRGEGGAVLRAEEGRTLVLRADVRLVELRIENQRGHGVVVQAGAPVLEACAFAVGDVAVGCHGQAAPVLRGCQVERARTGLFATDDSAPEAEELVIVASGGGMLFRGRARGHLRQVAIVSGQYAAVEVREQAAPVFEGLAVPAAATGALFLHEQSAPRFRELIVQKSGLAAVEIAGSSTGTVEVARLEGAGGSGIFVHGQARPTVRDVEIVQPALAGVEAAEQAAPDCEGLRIEGGAGSGLYLRGESRGTWRGIESVGAGKAGVEAAEQADPTIDGLSVVEPRGGGLFLHDRSRGTWLDVRVQGAALAGVEIAGYARPEVENLVLFGGQQSGLWIHDEAEAEVLGARISHQLLAAVEVADGGRLVLEDATITDTRGGGLRLLDRARADLSRLAVTDCGGDALSAAGTAQATWRDGQSDAPISATDQATVQLLGVAHARLAPTADATITTTPKPEA